MTKLVGQFMRLGGLVIEMLGVLAVMKGNDGIFGTKVHLPGFEPVALAWIGVALGFVLWMVGTGLVYGSRPSRKASEPDRGETLYK